MVVGVQLSTSTIPGAGAATRPSGSGYIAVYQTERGNPNVPVLVESMQQYEQLFGGAVSYGFGWNDLSMFFGEGGTYAWVQRVVGTGATAGSISLNDTTTPTPQPTLQLFAGCPSIDPVTGNSLGNVKDPGAWSANLSVAVVASQITGQYKIEVYYSGALVETWGPFPDVPTAVSKINSSSSYLYAVNLNSTSTGTTANPAVAAATALSAGNDERASITATTMSGALANVPSGIAEGEWASIAGYDASLVGDALEAWAEQNNCDVGLYPTQGMTESTVAAAAANFRGSTGSEKAGYFWPWVLIPDGAGGSLVVPPDGYIAGVRSRTVAAVGPWQAPAGNWGVARYVIGLDPASGPVTDTVGDALNDEHVNVIRPKNGIRLYGWRSLSTDMVNYPLLTQSDVLNNVAAELATVEQQYAFATIDSLGQLGSEMANSAKKVLQPFIDAGALWPGPAGTNGQPSDPGYLIDTGPSVNTAQSIAADQYGIAVYVRPAGSAETIPVKVVKVAIGNAF